MEERAEVWRVAAEYDKATFGRLDQELRALGYVLDSEYLSAAELDQGRALRITGPSGQLVVENRKHIGLIVTGPVVLVEELRKKYCEKYPLSLWAAEQSRNS